MLPERETSRRRDIAHAVASVFKFNTSFSFVCSPDREKEARRLLKSLGVKSFAEGLTPFTRLEGICPPDKQLEITDVLLEKGIIMPRKDGSHIKFDCFIPGEFIPPPINTRAA